MKNNIYECAQKTYEMTKSWVESSEGQEAIRDAVRLSYQVREDFRKAKQLHPKVLNRPFI